MFVLKALQGLKLSYSVYINNIKFIHDREINHKKHREYPLTCVIKIDNQQIHQLSVTQIKNIKICYHSKYFWEPIDKSYEIPSIAHWKLVCF